MKGACARSLAQVRSAAVVARLLEIAKDDKEQDLTRALACAALGLACATEAPSTFAVVSAAGNYRASTDLVNELFSLL